VLVQGEQFGVADAVVLQQMARIARILRRHDPDRAEHIQRAQRDVTQISNRGGDYI